MRLLVMGAGQAVATRHTRCTNTGQYSCVTRLTGSRPSAWTKARRRTHEGSDVGVLGLIWPRNQEGCGYACKYPHLVAVSMHLVGTSARLIQWPDSYGWFVKIFDDDWACMSRIKISGC